MAWNNRKPYILNKNVNLVITFWWGRCPTIVVRGLGKGREDEGCSFAGFSFSPCIIFYFAFENQSDGCDKQHNICFKRKDLKIFTRACTLARSWRLCENMTL